MWVVVGVLSLALAAHQGWSANLFTTTSDMFPKVAVASVVGIGGALGQLGNVLILYFAGWIVTVRGQKGGYFIVFMVCGCAYLVALGIIHLFSPRLEQAKLD
jgi:ACS family hexuronate transporter-like MFS transporter